MQNYESELYEVFVSISGPRVWRDRALEVMGTVKDRISSPELKWNIYDSSSERLPQMEHLRLLVQKSDEYGYQVS